MEESIRADDKKMFKEFTKFMYGGIKHGAKEYGAYSYLQLDMIRMAKEEARDLANYGYFLWRKLSLLEKKLSKILGTSKI